METIIYHQATPDHISSIVKLTNDHAAKDNDKIAILPLKFRQRSIEESILQKKLYCATTRNNEVIAFKKLFIINDQREYENLLTQCIGEKPTFYQAASFNSQNKKDKLYFNIDIPWSFNNSIVIYNGSDYTHPTHRGKGFNSLLTTYAFSSIMENENFQKIISNKCILYVVLLYGLTPFNAGEMNGIDRTPSIVRSLREFINILCINHTTINKANNIIHKSYISSMPLYEAESSERIPHKLIPKYGNVLIFPLS